MKFFITGASGLLGSNLSYISANNGQEVLAAYNEHAVSIKKCNMIQLNLRESDFSEIIAFKPNCIIHCAALTNVDLCEQKKQLAQKVNVGTTERIVELAKKTKSKLVFISTDSIFDGTKSFHKEEDRFRALNFYAKTKIKAEEEVRKLESHVIIRTNFYGFNIQKNKQSFSEWLYSKFKNNEKITAFTDFYFSPIVANNLAEAIIEIVESDFNGTLHVAGDGRISKYGFALKFADTFSFDRSLVAPKKMVEMQLKAKRPKDCSLDISKAKKILKTKLLNIDDGIAFYKRLYNDRYQDKLSNS